MPYPYGQYPLRFNQFGETGLANLITQNTGVGVPAWLLPAIARMSVPPSSADLSRIARLGRSIPNAKLDLFHRLNAETDQASLQNWIANAFNLTKADAPTFTAGRGFTGDGVNDALSTGFTPSSAGGKFTQDAACMGILILGPANASGVKVEMGAQGGGGNAYIAVNGTSPLLRLNAAADMSGAPSDGVLGLITLVRRSSTVVDIYYGRVKAVTASSTSTALSTGVLRYLSSTSSLFSNRSVSHGFAGGEITDSEVQAMADAIHQDARETGAYLKRAAIICDGNSLTVGYNAQTPYSTVLQSAYDSQPLATAVINRAVSGQTVQDMITRLSSSGVIAALQYPADRRVLVAWELRNSISTGGRTVSQAVDDLESYCVAARAKGADKIIVCNTIADGSGDPLFTPTAKAQVNALLASRYQNFADYLVDLAADSRFQNANDTTYYGPDKIHLISAGYAVVEALVKPVVDQALASLGIS